MTDHDLTWYPAIAKPGRTFDAVCEFVGVPRSAMFEPDWPLIVAKRLKETGLTAFAPREMRQRRMIGKGKAREAYAVPAVGSYLFVGTDGRQPHVAGLKHTIDLLRIAGDAARIDHGSIARMRKLDGIWSTDIRYGGVSPRALRVGDEVTIGDNPWGAVKVTALSKGLVTVTFQAFGSERQTTVKRSVIDAAMEAA